MPADRFMIEHDAYLDVVDHLDRFDAVHNNSLHYLPVVTPISRPIVHTLHTPPTPWLESAYRVRDDRRQRRGTVSTSSHVASVSMANASQWQHHVDEVIHNGVELDRWRAGLGGHYAVWSGRIVPEKGLHLAIEAASLAGIDLLIAGPIHDRRYFDHEIRPRLVDRTSTYLGHLRLDELATLTAGAAVAVVTPCWEEPFGLVAAEALACATPIAAFDRGALVEIVTDEVGALAAANDQAGLSRAIVDACGKDRSSCRRRAVARFSAAVMASRYVSAYVDAGACR
jgi:glycosyltransferase involved in cell wall biosynthesis